MVGGGGRGGGGGGGKGCQTRLIMEAVGGGGIDISSNLPYAFGARLAKRQTLC